MVRAGAARVLVLSIVLLVACSQAATGPGAPGGPAAGPAPRAAADGPGATAPAPARLIVSYSELSATELPLWIAQEAGIFQKNGLEVEQQLIESATGMPALIAGETQIAQLGGSNVLGAVVGGADIVVVGTLAPTYPYVFQTHPSIRSVEELRGQKVGVSRLGAASDVATRLSLRKVGLEPDRDVSILQVGSASARTAAMLSNAIQGAMVQPPDTMVLEAQGFNNLFDLAALDLPTSQLTIAVQRAFATANRDVVQRYVDSIVEGSARQRQDRALAIEVLRKYLRSDNEPALAVTYDYYTNKVLAALPYPRAEQFQEALEQLAEKNERARGFDVERMLDASFVQSAADRDVGR
jgi:NitT/TauT family transport system substrate-binding protein